MGRPGVPSWIDTAGGQERHRSESADPTVDQEWAEAGHVEGSSRAQAALSRALAYGLWGGIALALVLGLVNCAGSSATAPPPSTDPAPAQPVPPPGGCAELVVAAWLAGNTDILSDIPGVPNARPEPGRRQATRTYTAAVTPGNGAWAYLVGAEVQVREEEGDPWQPAGTQFFTVTMMPSGVGCQGWSPAALPAQTSPPLLASDVSPLPYRSSLPHSGTELSATLEAFFAGLLTGAGDLERYVAPGVFIPAVVPPPYQQVGITELRAHADHPIEQRGTAIPPDGTVVQLLATVETDEGDDLPLVYPVTVGVRGGRWEVVAVDPLVGTTAIDNPAQPATGGAPTDPTESTNGGG